MQEDREFESEVVGWAYIFRLWKTNTFFNSFQLSWETIDLIHGLVVEDVTWFKLLFPRCNMNEKDPVWCMNWKEMIRKTVWESVETRKVTCGSYVFIHWKWVITIALFCFFFEILMSNSFFHVFQMSDYRQRKRNGICDVTMSWGYSDEITGAMHRLRGWHLRRKFNFNSNLGR